ncbi:hypothetical protein [Streptomyces sp. NPDC060002]|uniref:hypothetical protein n=1 Tax=Streptomyces sp. NPDC060002 TaxID=3347033 RepID=UPI0036C764D1
MSGKPVAKQDEGEAGCETKAIGEPVVNQDERETGCETKASAKPVANQVAPETGGEPIAVEVLRSTPVVEHD